jgi:putative membrane protein
MHIGKSYKITEFLYWTRRSIFYLLLLGAIPVLLYQVAGIKWLVIPWPVVALLGTATAFIVGFKNQQTYNRTWEARQVWGGLMGASRSWAVLCKDFIPDQGKTREVLYLHLAWLTVVRYQLRAGKNWETTNSSHNREYQRYYTIPEVEVPLESELRKYLSEVEISSVLSKNNKQLQLMAMQSDMLTAFNKQGLLEDFRYLAMHNALRELATFQGKSERIKNFPYPRQYATINTLFVKLFCVLLPPAMLGAFDALNEQVTGVLKGYMVWLVIPFSMLLSWVYTSLDQVGESTANPFEGSANDVPISQMTRSVEIDIRELLSEKDLPPALQPQHNIVM